MNPSRRNRTGQESAVNSRRLYCQPHSLELFLCHFRRWDCKYSACLNSLGAHDSCFSLHVCNAPITSCGQDAFSLKNKINLRWLRPIPKIVRTVFVRHPLRAFLARVCRRKTMHPARHFRTQAPVHHQQQVRWPVCK